MVDVKYGIAYKEVLEILKYISETEYNKIPMDKINLFKENAKQDYDFNYNPNKTLEEQGTSQIAKGIIAILFRDYWATEKQKEIIIAKQNDARKILEDEIREKYNPDNIFKNNKQENFKEDNVMETAMVEYKENIFKKIFNKIKRILRLK